MKAAQHAHMVALIEKTFHGGKRTREWEVEQYAHNVAKKEFGGMRTKGVVAVPVPHASLGAAWMASQEELCQAAFELWRRCSTERSVHVCASRCTTHVVPAATMSHLCTTAFTLERNMVHDEHKVVALAAAGSRTAHFVGGYVIVQNEVMFDAQPFLIVPPDLCAQLRSIKTLFIATPDEAHVVNKLFAVQNDLLMLLEDPRVVAAFKSEGRVRALLRSAALFVSKITKHDTEAATRVATMESALKLCARFPPTGASEVASSVTLAAGQDHVEGMPFASRKALAQRRNQLTGANACGYYA